MSETSTPYKFNREFITSMVCMVHACIHTIPNAKVDMRPQICNVDENSSKTAFFICSVRLAWYIVIDSLSEHCKKSNKQMIPLLSYCRKLLFWGVNWDLFSEHLPDLLQIINVIMLNTFPV